MTSPTPQPDVINKLRFAAYSSFAMYAGMKLEVFTPLKDGPLTVHQLAQSLNVNPTRLGPLLYALVVAELLTVEDGRFANTPEAAQFLIKGNPGYMGGVHGVLTEQWTAAMKVAESISADAAQVKLDFSGMSEEELEPLYRGLHAAASTTGRALAKLSSLSTCRNFVDVGGGSAGVAIAVTEELPQVSATVAELPTITPITRRFVDEAGAADRVQVVPVDICNEALQGSYDVAVMRNLIQVLSPDEARRAIKNTSGAVKPGGAIHIVGQVLDDSRLTPVPTVGINLFFIGAYDGGQAFTEQEHRDWLAEAGFEDFERSSMAGGFTLVSARKPT